MELWAWRARGGGGARVAMSAAGGLYVGPTPDTSMLDMRHLTSRKLKRQNSGGSRMGSLQPHPMRPFLWACKLNFHTMLARMEQAFGPALVHDWVHGAHTPEGNALRRAQVFQNFCGRNRRGNKDHEMGLGVRGYYVGARPSDDEDSVTHLWYKLTFHIGDRYGEILEARGVQWIVLSQHAPVMQRQLSACLGSYLRGALDYTWLPEHARESGSDEEW